jgi:excisionase family DNA binding protein
VSQAARVLGVSRQALYAAIKDGRLAAVDEGSGLRVPAAQLIAYGIRSGKEPTALVKSVQQEAGSTWIDSLVSLLIGLGLVWMVASLLGKLFPSGNGNGQGGSSK